MEEHHDVLDIPSGSVLQFANWCRWPVASLMMVLIHGKLLNYQRVSHYVQLDVH